MALQKITPHLWYAKGAEEAANYYVSVFPNSKIGDIARYGKEGFEIHGQKEGTVMTVEFELDGQKFIALNGGPIFTFNEAISFLIDCETQEEMDYYTEKLSADPKAEQCGWVKDQFGLSWQVNWKKLATLIADPDPKKSGAVMTAMLAMKRLDAAALQAAYDRA